MTSIEPPTSSVSRAGLAATDRKLAKADRTPVSSRVLANCRPLRVPRTMPASAAATARISSSLLADGSLNAAVYPFHDQQRRSVSGLDHPFDTRDMDAGPLGDDPSESLVLDSLDERESRPGVADISQASDPVRAVEQVSVTLICADGLDEQRAPVVGDGDEWPRALRFDARRKHGADRKAG